MSSIFQTGILGSRSIAIASMPSVVRPARLTIEAGSAFAEIEDRSVSSMLHVDRLELFYPRLKFPLHIERGLDDFRRRASFLKLLSLRIGLDPMVSKARDALSRELFHLVDFRFSPPWHLSMRGLWIRGNYPCYFVLDSSLRAIGGKLLVGADDLRSYSLGPPPLGVLKDLATALPPEWLSISQEGVMILEPLEWLSGRVAEACGWVRHPHAGLTQMSLVKVSGEEMTLEAHLPASLLSELPDVSAAPASSEQPFHDRSELLMGEGDAFLLQGRLMEAIQKYEDSIATRPELLSAYVRLAQVLAGTPEGQPQAEKLCEEGLRRRKDFWPLDLTLSLIEEARGDWESSLSRYDRFLSSSREGYELDVLPSHIKAGTLCQRLGRLEEAKAHFDAAIQLDSRSYPAMQGLSDLAVCSGRWTDALEWTKTAIRVVEGYNDSHRLSRFCLDMGRIRRRGFQDLKAARDAFVLAGQVDKTCFEAWLEIAELSEMEQDLEEALRLLRELRVLAQECQQPRFESEALLRLARLHYFTLNQPEEGLREAREATWVEPGNPACWRSLADYSRGLEEWQVAVDALESLACLQEVSGSAPEAAQTRTEVGRLLEEKLGQRAKALAQYRASVVLQPDWMDGWRSLVSLATMQGDWQEAVDGHEQLARLATRMGRPEEAGQSLHLAGQIWLQELSKSDRAVECYQKALKILPDKLETHRALGEVLYRSRKDPASAKPHLVRGVGLDPLDSELVRLLADVDQDLGQREASRLLLQALCVLDGKTYPEADESPEPVLPSTARSLSEAEVRALGYVRGYEGPWRDLFAEVLEILEEPLRWAFLNPIPPNDGRPLPSEEEEVYRQTLSFFLKEKQVKKTPGRARIGSGRGWFFRTESEVGILLPERVFKDLPLASRVFAWGKLAWHLAEKTYPLASASAEDWDLFVRSFRHALTSGQAISDNTPWSGLAQQAQRRVGFRSRRRCLALLETVSKGPDLKTWVGAMSASSDRAGLLACRDVRPALHLLLWSHGLPWPLSSSRMTLTRSLRRLKDDSVRRRVLDLLQHALSEEYVAAYEMMKGVALGSDPGRERKP